ncbi:MAG: hypothetical protein ABW223_01025, partial [Rariglobus sp.]
MKSRIRSLVFSSTLLALLPLSALANFSIYSPKDGLADGWKPIAWNGPITEEIAGATKETTALQINLKPDSKPYAGVVLTASSGSEIALTEKIRENGKVVITLKLGKTAEGAASTVAQQLQLGLSFLTKDGQTVHGKFVTQASVSTASATSAEGQVVTITVPASLEGVKAPELLASISSVRFQFVEAPLAGFV